MVSSASVVVAEIVKRLSERQNQEPHCKPKASEEQNQNLTQNKRKAKEKFEINVNKQEPGTKKKNNNNNHKPDCKAVTNESCIRLHSMPRGILRRNPRYVSFLLRNRHRHFSVLGAISFSVAHTWRS